MAFNPFSNFRKYGKTIMAGLAIMCMFLFVLSSGIGYGGDALDSIASWLGARGASVQAATIDGRRVTDRDLEKVRRRRQMANVYMAAAVAESHKLIVDQLDTELKKFPSDQQAPLSRIVNIKRQMSGLSDPQFGFFLAYQYYQQLPQLTAGVQAVLQQIDESNAEASQKQSQTNLLQRAQMMMEQDARRFGRMLEGRSDRELYFGGDLSTESLVNFLLWTKHADRLGIRYTADDVGNLFNAETLTRLSNESLKNVGDLIRDFPDATSANLSAALGDEFRARAAQASLAGGYVFDRDHVPQTDTALPTGVTPFDFFDFYKDVRTTLQVGLIPVEVKAYVSKVTETPTAAQLKSLFDKYASVEPNPLSPTPGFKLPRKVQLEWVTGSAELTYYQKAAVQAAQIIRAVAALGGAGAVDSGFVSTATSVAVPLTVDPALLAEFQRYRDQNDRSRAWVSAFIVGPSDLHERATIHPETLTGFLGQVLGDAVTAGAGPNAALGLLNQALVRDLRERARVGMTSTATALNLTPFAALGLPMAVPPSPLPFEAVRSLLVQKSAGELARKLFVADMEQFQADMASKWSAARTAQARDAVKTFVNEFVTSRGLIVARTDRPLSRWEIAESESLALLRNEYLKSSGQRDPMGREFGSRFLNTQGPAGVAGLFQGEWFPTAPSTFGGEGPNWLVWRTVDQDPRKRTFAEAEADVRAAWILDEARKLAQKDVETLTKKAEEAKGDRRKLLDLAYGDGRPGLIELGPMAELMPGPHHEMPDFLPVPDERRPPRDYEPYQLPVEKVADVNRGEMTEALLNLRKKDVGATIVQSNLPKTTFFVASLISKSVPDQAEFERTYKRSAPTVGGRDMLLARFQARQTAAFQLSVMDQLRRDAKVEINPEFLDRRRNSEPE